MKKNDPYPCCFYKMEKYLTQKDVFFDVEIWGECLVFGFVLKGKHYRVAVSANDSSGKRLLVHMFDEESCVSRFEYELVDDETCSEEEMLILECKLLGAAMDCILSEGE